MDDKLNKIMKAMPIEWRYFWCKAKWCACLGCANGSGGLLKAGYTENDWQKWVDKNPDKHKLPSRSSRAADACTCGRNPIALRCNKCGGLVPVKQPPA